MKNSALFLTVLLSSTQAQTTFLKANNNTALNVPTSWIPNGTPGSGDTVQFDSTLAGANTSAALGADMSVLGITQATGTTLSFVIGNSAGKTLSIGSGGITKNVQTVGFTLNCNVALSAAQSWTVNATNGTGLVFSGGTFTDNGNALEIKGSTTSNGLFDVRTAGAVTFDSDVTIKTNQLNINNAAANVTMGGANTFKQVIIANGTLQGSSLPADNLSGTSSNLGNASAGTVIFGANSTAAATLIYNGNTASTPKTFTYDARNTGAANINVSTAGQTLTLTAASLLYTQGASQSVDKNWNFGGAGNLTVDGTIGNASGSTKKIGVNKSDSGTLTLGGNNTYTGNTVVNGGTLALTGTATLASPSIGLTGGTTFDVTGLGSTFTLGVGQTLGNSTGAAATLNGNIDASVGTVSLGYNLINAPLTITNGTLTLSSSTVFNFSGGVQRLPVGTYPLISKGTGGSVTGSLPAITLAGATGHLAITGDELFLVVDTSTFGPAPLYWAGSGTGTWDSANSGNTIWKDSSTPTPGNAYFVSSDAVRFDETYISADQAVTLDTMVTPSSVLVSNGTYNYTISGTGTIGGASSLTKAGAAALTLGGTNSFTGGTTINEGTLKMASATAMGGNGSAASVSSGAALDLNSQTMTTATAYALTLNGTGISGSGALTNSGSTMATFFSSTAAGIVLGSDTTIKTGVTGAITLGSTGSARGITGPYALTVEGASLLDVWGDIQTASLTVNCATNAGIRLESSNSFAGGLTVKSGSAVAKNAGSFGGNGTGTVYLGDTTGSANATLNLGFATTFNNPIIVQAGNSGVATIDNFANYSPVLAATLTLNKTVTLLNFNTTGAQNLTVSGTLTGIGGVTVAANHPASPVTLAGPNDYSGDTTVDSGILVTGGTNIPNAGKLVINGGKVQVTGTEVVNTLFFGSAQQAAGTWGATGSGATHLDDTRFAGNSGVIQVTTGPVGYASWQTANSTSQTADQDHDDDGVANGVEFFLGGNSNTTGFTPLPGVVGNAITWVKSPTFVGSLGTEFKVQTSSDLVIWADAPSGGTPGVAGTVHISGDNVTYTLPTGAGKIFARLLVSPN